MSVYDKSVKAVSLITKHNDINMVFLIVVVIALMIIPMPTPLVDTLIGINMALSFLMLMMSMYVRTALDFSVFPTMLLFTTLFRVGLLPPQGLSYCRRMQGKLFLLLVILPLAATLLSVLLFS